MVDQGAPAQKRAELRRAISDLSERGLTAAARWAGEQLAGTHANNERPQADQYVIRALFVFRPFRIGSSNRALPCDPPGLPETEVRHTPSRSARHSRTSSSGTAANSVEEEDDTYQYAKSLFDMKVLSPLRYLATVLNIFSMVLHTGVLAGLFAS